MGYTIQYIISCLAVPLADLIGRRLETGTIWAKYTQYMLEVYRRIILRTLQQYRSTYTYFFQTIKYAPFYNSRALDMLGASETLKIHGWGIFRQKIVFFC